MFKKIKIKHIIMIILAIAFISSGIYGYKYHSNLKDISKEKINEDVSDDNLIDKKNIEEIIDNDVSNDSKPDVSKENDIINQPDKNLGTIDPPKQIINKYIVVFDTDGGSSINNQTINENSFVSKPTVPTKRGYIFNGWTLNGNIFNFSTPITSNIMLTANWKVDPTPEWQGQIATFLTKLDCQTEGSKHTDYYVPQCDDVYNIGGILLGYQLTLTKKNSSPLERWTWTKDEWIKQE